MLWQIQPPPSLVAPVRPPRARRVRRACDTAIAVVAAALIGAAGARAEETRPDHGAASLVTASAPARTLDECVALALQNHQRRAMSRFAVAAAEAQLRQAVSAYWPQLSVSATYQHADEAPTFVFPASAIAVPAQSITTPPSTALITVPAGVLGPTAVQLPVSIPAQTVATAPGAIPVPAQTIKLMDPEFTAGSASFQWLLFDGGMRSGLRQQGEAAVAAMKAESRRTDLEVVDAVTRTYYGAVLARQVYRLGEDTLQRLEATLSVTQSLYQGGGGKVTKADYLDNKVTVESVRALVATLEKNQALAEAALANTMGLSWRESVTPATATLPYAPAGVDLDQLVGEAYEFSPDWQQMDAGLNAAAGAVTTAKSGHAPKVALTGNLHRWWNHYDAGMATAANKQGWTAGIGLELPIFDGFLTRNRVAEGTARLARLKAQQLLLREGIGLQIKAVFLELAAQEKAFAATEAAQQAAEQNRELNVRAYESELVETEKVIRAQIMDAFMTAQHLKVRYDHCALRSQLTLLVGTELGRQLGAPTAAR